MFLGLSESIAFAVELDDFGAMDESVDEGDDTGGGQLKRDLRRYVRPRLLILDELGYLPIDKTGADLLFQIISQRYERASIAITTNRVFKH